MVGCFVGSLWMGKYFVRNRNSPTPLFPTLALPGAGCFWCVEAVYQRVVGVESVESGYMGGIVKNPSYGQVVNTSQPGFLAACGVPYFFRPPPHHTSLAANTLLVASSSLHHSFIIPSCENLAELSNLTAPPPPLLSRLCPSRFARARLATPRRFR